MKQTLQIQWELNENDDILCYDYPVSIDWPYIPTKGIFVDEYICNVKYINNPKSFQVPLESMLTQQSEYRQQLDNYLNDNIDLNDELDEKLHLTIESWKIESSQ